MLDLDLAFGDQSIEVLPGAQEIRGEVGLDVRLPDDRNRGQQGLGGRAPQGSLGGAIQRDLLDVFP